MTQYIMNANGNGNMEAERQLFDEIRIKQIERGMKKTDLEEMKHQPETMRLQYEENCRSLPETMKEKRLQLVELSSG